MAYIRALGDIPREQLRAKLKIQKKPRTSYADRRRSRSHLRQSFD